MSTSATIEAFRTGKLELDCKSMTLAQRKEGGRRYIGPGYIRQSTEGELVFKIYVTYRENAHHFDGLTSGIKRTAGILANEDELYELTAVGHEGTVWRGMRIWPSFNWDTHNDSVIAAGPLHSIMAELDRPADRSFLRLHFFEEYEIPTLLMSEVEERGSKYFVRERAEFEACGSKFEVRKREGAGETLVEASSERAFPPFFGLRIQEAFQYLTAKPAFWGARIETQGGKLTVELISPRRRSSRTQMRPPIGRHSIEFLQQGWRLFAHYLAYVVEKTEGTHWNPVAYHLYNAAEASANSVDAWAIGVSVAVEALSSLAQGPLSPSGQLAEFQACLRQFVTEQTAFTELQERTLRLIDSMGHPRPQDALHALGRTGHIEKRYISAWTDLRNRQVHPKLSDLKQPDPIDYEKLLQKIHRVQVLLYQLTFHLIGYEGPFTDYGEPEWPIRLYPQPP
jgi:hypothetical protein